MSINIQRRNTYALLNGGILSFPNQMVPENVNIPKTTVRNILRHKCKSLFTCSHTRQYPRKLNVWAGIVGGHIIGLFFINGNLNSERYLQLLQHAAIPAVDNITNNLADVWFQQDRCSKKNQKVSIS